MTQPPTSRTLRARGVPVLSAWLVPYVVSRRVGGGAWEVKREGQVSVDAHTAAQATVLAERYLGQKLAVERQTDRQGGEWVVVTGGPTVITRVRESDFDDRPLIDSLEALGRQGNRLAESLARVLAEADKHGDGATLESELFEVASVIDR